MTIRCLKEWWTILEVRVETTQSVQHPCRFVNAISHSQGSGVRGEMADDRAGAGEGQAKPEASRARKCGSVWRTVDASRGRRARWGGFPPAALGTIREQHYNHWTNSEPGRPQRCKLTNGEKGGSYVPYKKSSPNKASTIGLNNHYLPLFRELSDAGENRQWMPN